MVGSRSLLRDYVEALLIAVIFATFARTYVVQAFKIPTGSMEENLLVGDHILVNKYVFAEGTLPAWLEPTRDVRRGDVVVFKFPDDPARDFIKRCIGLPGDEIKIIDKILFVNGERVDDESYTYRADPRTYPRSVFLPDSFGHRDNFGPIRVPEGEYFFLGDNRDNSNDSRFWGTVPVGFVKGRAFMVYWSFESEREPLGWPGFAGRLRQLGEVARNFLSGTRWERSFTVVR